jgi:hypothetical protein
MIKAGEAATKHLGDAGQALDGRSRDLTLAASHALSQIDEAGAALRARSQELSSASVEALRETERIGERLRDQGDIFEKRTGDAAARLAQVERRLGESGGAFAAAAEHAARSALETGVALGREAARMTSAAQQAYGHASKAADRFREQADALLASAKSAQGEADALRNAASTLRDSKFLESAAFVTDSLNAIAVDLYRLLDRELSDELWKRYYKGERGLFARRLLRDKDLDKIRARYQEDSDFRRYADRYLADFSRLLSAARSAEHEELLTAAFVTADVGKIYLLLREALSRKN